MGEITYTCTSGVTDSDWTTSANMWDTTSGTYGYTSVNDTTVDVVYAYTTITGTGTITKVEIGVSGYRTGKFRYAYLGISTSGTRYELDDVFRIQLTTTWDTYWFDVTSGSCSPPVFESREWTNNDINYANLYIYTDGHNPFSKDAAYKCYIDQLYWRVTTE
jgi:hypothetical protein